MIYCWTCWGQPCTLDTPLNLNLLFFHGDTLCNIIPRAEWLMDEWMVVLCINGHSGNPFRLERFIFRPDDHNTYHPCTPKSGAPSSKTPLAVDANISCNCLQSTNVIHTRHNVWTSYNLQIFHYPSLKSLTTVSPTQIPVLPTPECAFPLSPAPSVSQPGHPSSFVWPFPSPPSAFLCPLCPFPSPPSAFLCPLCPFPSALSAFLCPLCPFPSALSAFLCPLCPFPSAPPAFLWPPVQPAHELLLEPTAHFSPKDGNGECQFPQYQNKGTCSLLLSLSRCHRPLEVISTLVVLLQKCFYLRGTWTLDDGDEFPLPSLIPLLPIFQGSTKLFHHHVKESASIQITLAVEQVIHGISL